MKFEAQIFPDIRLLPIFLNGILQDFPTPFALQIVFFSNQSLLLLMKQKRHTQGEFPQGIIFSEIITLAKFIN